MSVRIEFWMNSGAWPRDNSKYLFLARAVHEIGRSIFGSEWKGDEPCLDPLRPLPVLPVSSGSLAYLAHELLVKHHPELGRENLRWPRGGFPPSVKFTGTEWEAARAIVARDHAQKLPGLRRFAQTQDRIIGLAEAGELVTALRPIAGGDPVPISRVLWNSERIRNRFDFCQMNPNDPFGIGSSGDRYQWIFVDRESLRRCATRGFVAEVGFAASPEASLPPGAQGESVRRIAACNIEPEFKRWREHQLDGYVPTESEDIAYMKKLGVSRDEVRQLRKNFPTRKRGEKKRL